jgi:hypothetical protein
MTQVTEIVAEEGSGKEHTLTVYGTRINDHPDPGVESISALGRVMVLEDGREVESVPGAHGRYKITGSGTVLRRVRLA